MMDKRQVLIKRLVISFSVLVLLGAAAGVIINRLNTYHLSIISDPEAEIFVALEPEAPMESLGVGDVSFSTKQEEAVFFKAVKGSQESIVSVYPKDSNGQDINMPLIETVGVEKIIEGPLVDAMEEGNYIFGISANTNSIISVGTDRYRPPKLSYVGLPFMNEIIWGDSNNFVYERFGGGIGAFINGENRGASYFGSGNENDDTFYAVAKYGNRPLVALGANGIYTSSGLGRTIENVFQNQLGEAWYLQSDDQHIYHASYDLPHSHATETEDVSLGDLDDDDLPSAQVYVFDYQGNVMVNTTVHDASRVYEVVAENTDGNFAVLSDKSIHLISSAGEVVMTYPNYYQSAVNMAAIEGRQYAIDQTGVWLLDLETGLRQLASKFEFNQDYVPGSVEIDGNDIHLTLTGSRPSGESGVYVLTP